MATLESDRYSPPASWRKEAFLETYRSQNAFISEAFKWMAIAGGGAAVATLTQYGAGSSECSNAPNLIAAVAFFSGTLFATILAYCSAYVSQMHFLKHLAELEHASGTQSGSTRYVNQHIYWFFAALFVLVAGLLCFVLGAWSAAIEFSEFQCQALLPIELAR